MKNLKEFCSLLNLRKVNDDLNVFIEKSDWKKPQSLKFEHTYFNPLHAAGYGLNGNSKLVEFTTKILEADSIHFTRHWDANSTFISVYLNTTGTTRETDKTYAVELKNPKGKRFQRHSLDTGWMKVWFGYNPVEVPEKIETEVQDGNVIRLVKIDDDYRGRVERFYQNLIDDIKHDRDNFEKFVNSRGWKISNIFKYNYRFDIHPCFVKQTKTSIEIGWNTNFTYYSHPNTLKISKVKSIPTVNLKDIGVETRGYYDHHVNMHVRPEQVRAIKKFSKHFNKMKGSK